MKEEYYILMENVSYAYDKMERVLKDITLSFGRGEMVALIGQNGAGKTTLLMVMVGLLKGEGRVFFKGEELDSRSILRARRAIGFLFQNPEDQLFSKTVLDDVSFGPRALGVGEEEVRRKVLNAMRAMKVSSLSARSPFELSHGEKKRVAIAGMLACDPEVLILDEPGGGLDPFQKSELIEYLRGERRTVVFATHDMDFSWQVAARCILLHRGTVVCEGPAREVLRDEVLLQSCGLDLPLLLRGAGMGKALA